MGKSSKSLFIGALASTLFSGVAFAADYIPPPIVDFEPEFELELGGNLYLRGYVGFTNQEVDRLDNALFSNPVGFEFLSSEFEAGGLAGAAVGYRFNEWFRADISAEYRMRTGYDGLDRYDTTGDGTWDGTNQYTADKSEFLVMANAFVDLGTYHGITPYVGGGIGASYTMIDNLTDTNTPTSSVAYASDNGEWAFAWALHAGLGYEVSDRVTLDFGYRYLDIGDASSGDIIAFGGANNIANPMEFEGITSHDVTFGFRYALGGFGGGHSSGYGHSSY
ncbi:outer membrane beta-barrel protein [Ahrensia marina]|uniref:outer membrane protein n=1 Tax=Ahrensia marina TaxID=1514904 RepID=UPI0035D0F60C